MSKLKTKANIALLRGKLAAYKGKDALENVFKNLKKDIKTDDISNDVQSDIEDMSEKIEKHIENGGQAARQKISVLLDKMDELLSNTDNKEK